MNDLANNRMSASNSHRIDFDTPVLQRKRRIRALKDRMARWYVSIGGLAVLGCITLIFFYLAYVVAPMFGGADLEAREPQQPAWLAEQGEALLLSVEEQNKVAMRLSRSGQVQFFGLKDGVAMNAYQLALPAGASIVSVVEDQPGSHRIALGLSNGQVLVFKHVYKVTYPNNVKTITPQLARTGVSNFFANLGDAWSFVNNVLQLHAEGALNSAVRFSVNTVLGIGGLFDVASEMGVDRRRQDFGLTLGRWGVPTGPYVVLPLLGSSTVRDTLALPVDAQGNLLSTVYPVTTRNSLLGLRLVNTRANLLRASEVLDTAALDKYTFTRDVFLNLRSQGMDAGDGSLGDGDDGGLQDGRLPDEPY